MDLAQVADELYGLAPGEFTVARDERSGRARAAGDRELAAAIARLRRPTVSAWLVNQLAREAGDGLDQLNELGAALRQAQQALAGERLRELSGQRRAQLRTLSQQAKRLAARAGQPVSAQTEREITATLEAALADPAAAAAVRSGRLTRALSHVGLGGPDLASHVAGLEDFGSGPRLVHSSAGPGTGRGAAGKRAARQDGGGLRAVPGTAPQGRAGRAPTARRQAREVTAARQAAREATAAAQQAAREAAAAERRAREVAAAERDVQDAQAEAEAASAALDQAQRRVGDAKSRRQAARELVEQLEQRLVSAQEDEARAIREVRDAQRGREAAARAVTAAGRQVLRAKARLSKLS